jgi:hypothetical protein
MLPAGEHAMTEVPLLDFYRHGHVTQRWEEETRYTLEECYKRLSGHPFPEKVEVRLCQTPAQMAEFLQAEKDKLGIQTLGDESFICSHDAWRGFPRLLICTERLFALSPMARLGTLRHEAAHTVLHGALAYYVCRIPRDCIELAQAKGMNLSLLQQVLYYCSIAVKDFEATRLLLHQGYRECQVAFAQAQFVPSDEDKFAWLLARGNPQARLLFFTSQLKALLLSWPLDIAGLFPLERYADSMLSYIEAEERKRWLDLVGSIAKQLGDDTHENIRLTLRKVLLEPL